MSRQLTQFSSAVKATQSSAAASQQCKATVAANLSSGVGQVGVFGDVDDVAETGSNKGVVREISNTAQHGIPADVESTTGQDA